MAGTAWDLIMPKASENFIFQITIIFSRASFAAGPHFGPGLPDYLSPYGDLYRLRLDSERGSQRLFSFRDRQRSGSTRRCRLGRLLGLDPVHFGHGFKFEIVDADAQLWERHITDWIPPALPNIGNADARGLTNLDNPAIFGTCSGDLVIAEILPTRNADP
jgi:hypothetical protein